MRERRCLAIVPQGAVRAIASAGVVVGLVAALVVACVPPKKPQLTLTPVRFEDLPGWAEDDQSAALGAFLRSCARLQSYPAGRSLGAGGVGGRAGDWHDACLAAAAVPGGDRQAARRFFAAWFTPYALAVGDDPEGLFTGYYEVELRGALRPGGRYRVPIYRQPADLITADLGLFRTEWKGRRLTGRVSQQRFVPYYSRAEIDAGALAGRGLELAWVDDPVDAFFLHIQGSGRIVIDGGPTLRVGYAGKNGHPYVAIGRELVRRGALSKDEVSMQTIRAWLATHPEEAAEVMASNASYVFFRRLEGDGPIGALQVVLTPGRSLAVDPAFVPLGAPLWLDTTDPLDDRRPLRRLAVAQDTGGAIKGPIRGDLFWGHGRQAAARAGRMNQRGRYYLLLPRTLTPATALLSGAAGGCRRGSRPYFRRTTGLGTRYCDEAGVRHRGEVMADRRRRRGREGDLDVGTIALDVAFATERCPDGPPQRPVRAHRRAVG